MANKATERAVLHLLRDVANFHWPFGGSEGFVDIGAMGQYGPAGFIEEGAAFPPRDARLLKESMTRVLEGTRWLRREEGDFAAWRALQAPYLSDPGDPSMVDHWRMLAAEARQRRRPKKKGMDLPVSQPERQVEDHDRAIRKVADYLEATMDVRDLYYVEPKRMSRDQERKMEDQNAAILAVYERHRAGGLRQAEAVKQTVEDFWPDATVDSVERIVEFRHHHKREECAEANCERVPFAQGLCAGCYHKRRRQKKKGKARER